MVYAKTVSSANFETPRGEMRSKVLKLETFAITARVLSINLLERMWLGFFLETVSGEGWNLTNQRTAS